MTRAQVSAVIAALSVALKTREDIEFGRSAVEYGHASDSSLAECLELQEAAVAAGRDAPPLPLLLYEKRAMQENHIIALLKAAEGREKGLLYRIRNAAERKPESRLQRILKQPGSKRMLAQAGVGAIVLAGLVIFLALRFSGPGEYATVECANCHALGGAPADSEWPVKCTECGKEAMYPQAICLECGTRFPVKGLGYGTACPECKSSSYVLITNRVDLEEIESEIESRRAAKRDLP